MSKWHRPAPAGNLPRRGTHVVLRGVASPTMTVVRHTQFDNGEVECIWFTPDARVQRAWLPADLLSTPPRVSYKPRSFG